MKNDQRRARIGIIGCGTITQNVHIPSIERLPDDIELVALSDVDLNLARQVARLHHVETVYQDYREMLAKASLDAVMITVGDPLHVPIALEALAAGKDVFVEKPLGTTVEECLHLRDAASRTDRFVQMGNMRRFDAGVVYARDAVAGTIAEVQSFNAWYRSSAASFSTSGGAYLPTIRPPGYRRPDWKLDREKYALDAHASHLFDHIRFVVGAPKRIQAILGSRGENYSFQGTMELENGAVGRFELTYETSAPWSEGLEVYGTNGSVRLDMAPVAEHRASFVKVFDASTLQTVEPYLTTGGMYVNQLKGFAQAVLRQIEPRSTVHDGLAVMRDIRATRQSVASGGIPVQLPRPESNE